MAWLESIRIGNLRCLRSVEVALPRGLVWIVGPNGAGKTTFLEAVYLLDRGRTFRGRRSGPLTTQGERRTAINGLVISEQERRYRVAWDSSGSAVRPVSPATRFVGSTSFSLLEGDPALRRQFFDWALFHVEHDAKELWVNLARLQRQRNAWLRAGGRGAAVWDVPYSSHLEAVWTRRARFLERLDEAFYGRTQKLLPAGGLRLEWKWTGQREGVAQLLRAQLKADIERGFTFLSASRGDVAVRRKGAAWRGSRGENKIAGILLQLAAQDVMAGATGRRPIVLLDDPYAEVNAARIRPLIEAWMGVSDQLIIARLDDVTAPEIPGTPTVTFHVEQGRMQAQRNG